MEKLKSKKFKIPDIYFISDRNEIKDIPIGLPYVYGNEKDKIHFIQLLEWEVLYQKLVKTGLPFNWELILKEHGYSPTRAHWHNAIYYNYITSDENYDKIIQNEINLLNNVIPTDDFKKYINDCSALINMDKLKTLKLIPDYQNIIEEAVKTNIHNFISFNHNMYNKKLEGMYGGLEFTSPNRNVIILDISGSMTKSISINILLMAKTMSETYYADILITGTKSILYPYEEIHTLNIEDIYNAIGGGNEGEYFKKILSEPKNYKTAIVFGDNDYPGSYSYYKITDEDGKKLCKWNINEIISFHKDYNDKLAGYARWFTTKNIQYIKNWVKYLN